MEYVKGEPLSSIWTTYTEAQKWVVARSIADIIIDLADITFDRIGGLTLEHKMGPTVEVAKIYNGRVCHRQQCPP